MSNLSKKERLHNISIICTTTLKLCNHARSVLMGYAWFVFAAF